MKTYYHVTKMAYLDSILRHGLIPFIGPLSKSCGEDVSRIYLFPDLQSMETALSAWLGDALNEEYGETTKFCSLKITLPDDFPIQTGCVPYESYSYDVIPPNFITYLKEE